MEIVKDIEVAPHFEGFLTNWKYRIYLTVGGYGRGKSYNITL